jgi:hypothetical protein
LLDEEEQNLQIRILANFLRSQKNKITFFKTDIPFDLSNQKAFLNTLASDRRETSIQQLKDIEKAQNYEHCYFFFIYGYTEDELENNVNNSLAILNQKQLTATQLLSETAKFLMKKFFMSKYSSDKNTTPYYLNFNKNNFHTEKE